MFNKRRVLTTIHRVEISLAWLSGNTVGCAGTFAASPDGVAVANQIETSQKFDDSCFFQRLTLIDICCGPPGAY